MRLYKQYNPFARISKKEKHKEVQKPEESTKETKREGVDAIEDFFWKNQLDTIDASKFTRRSNCLGVSR